MKKSNDPLLQQQIDYYRERAREYDEWFLRQGRCDRGPQANHIWFQEIKEVRQALARFGPTGEILELAAGTGQWTEQLIAYASRITAVDAAAETLAQNKQRLQSPKVDYVQADIFTWRPERRFDVVFFSFWLSHVPPERFAAFWETVGNACKPGGRVFFVDSRYSPSSTAVNHRLGKTDDTTVKRRLNNGRKFVIYKIFYKSSELASQLEKLGWRADIRETDNYFLYGEANQSR
jgi:demethylmenaquinone methyltransferase/2-methoxy-6-polyprenyl-1,4-benzoquinol methylase